MRDTEGKTITVGLSHTKTAKTGKSSMVEEPNSASKKSRFRTSLLRSVCLLQARRRSDCGGG